MKVSRRTILKITGVGVFAAAIMPRVAMAAPNSVRSVRTGVQPNGKTRLVIETATRPTYSMSYPENQLVIKLANTAANKSMSAKLSDAALVRSISQVQAGDTIKIVADLNKPISEIARGQIMVLEPNGDSDYRLVLDFSARAGGAVATKTASASTTTKSNSGPAQKYVVVIDAGHGGKDPGCIGKGGTQEKAIVLSVAKKLRDKLSASGFRAHLTRSGDKYLKLAERAEIAEKQHADLFISLHANANPSRDMRGFSIYTLSEKASDEEAKKLAEAENAADKIGVEGFTDFEPNIRSALSALQQHAVAELSEEYANGCSRAFRNAKIEQQPGPGVRHAPFAVLRSTVPGALIELGHLSNKSEEKLLKSDAHQNKLVNAIVKSIKNYNFDV